MTSLLEKTNHMTDVLVQELSESDINWMQKNGCIQQVSAGTVLLQEQSNLDCLYLVLKGTLSASITRNTDSALGKIYGTLEDNLEQEITRFDRGEVIGETSFLNFSPSAITVKAEEDSLVLALPRERLLARFRQDVGFASRFYRAIAILLLDRFERLVKKFIYRQYLKISPLQDVPLLFGELRDSDVDWLIQHGQVEFIAPGIELIQAGRPLEYLYVILRGKVSVFAQQGTDNFMDSMFGILEGNDHDSSPATEIASSLRAEIIGETALINARLPIYTFKAAEDSQVLVLAINKQQLTSKLQQKPEMGARLYRVIAMLLSGRLQGLISRLGYGRSSYRVGEALIGVEYEDELGLNEMENISQGGARFEWMLKRLQVWS